MQRTIDLPDDLAQRLDAYLQEHPEETFYSLPHQKYNYLDSSNCIISFGLIGVISGRNRRKSLVLKVII